MVLLLSVWVLLVPFASRSGGVASNTKANTEAPAQKTKYQNKYRDERAPTAHYDKQTKKKVKHNKHTTKHTCANSPQQKMRNPNTPENTSRWETFGPNTRRLFFCAPACLWKCNKVVIAREDDVRTFQLVPNECSLLTYFRGVPGAHRQKESDGVARQRRNINTQLFA